MADRALWQQAVNVAPADNSTVHNTAASLAWFIFCAMTGRLPGFAQGAWTLRQCCDSVTVKTDGTNLFGETFNAAKWKSGTPSAGDQALSWFVLQAPFDLPLYLTLALYNGSPGTYHTASILVSRISPTGGTITAWPTASDTLNIHNGASLVTNTLYSHRFDALLSDVGDIVVLSGAANAAGPDFALIVTRLIGSTPGDMWPFGVYAIYSATAALNESNVGAGSAFLARNPSNVATLHNSLVLPKVSTSTSVLGNITAAGDVFDQTVPRLDAWLAYVATGSGFRGRLPDIALGPQNCAPQQNPANNPTQVLIKSLWLPFTQIPVF